MIKREELMIVRLPSEEGEDASWALFRDPLKVIVANLADEVIPALQEVESFSLAGKYVAGFLSYEASPAFDEALVVNTSDDITRTFPLLYFGVYDRPYRIFTSFSNEELVDVSASTPEISEDDYLADVKKIKKYIYDGDIYQANYTFRTKFNKIEDSYNLFCHLMKEHPVPYGAYIETAEFQILSLSPELFIEKKGDHLLSIPMKGTASREVTFKEDLEAVANLSEDPKNRAENIMIVDMVRNDLGRICRNGSIKVDPLCRVDTYSTLHQMVSEVYGNLKKGIGLVEIFTAMFPAASITGAPKIRAMEIIKELEESPRKLYTGSVGCITPEYNFCFNVAIRTLLSFSDGAELGIGSGIVADSIPEAEWNESLLKSHFLSSRTSDFLMLETILLKKRKFVLLDEHLSRVRNSQNYFGYIWDQNKVIDALNSAVAIFSESVEYAKVRLLIDSAGEVEVDISQLEYYGWGKKNAIIKLAEERTDSRDLFLYHKTTNRDFYNQYYRKALAEGLDEIIFMNEKGEITEGAISNIFIKDGGNWFTPPVKCGLLPGVWRTKLIRELSAEEKIFYLEDLRAADKIVICNSLRGETECVLLF